MSAEHHSPALAHHFDDLEQQYGSARLGMWMFLVTELLFFGGVFVAYTAYRIWYPLEFEAASARLNVLVAAINSLVLLTSSLTITLAIYAARAGNRAALMRHLMITAVLGTLFLVFKGFEYAEDFREHLLPGPSFEQHWNEHLHHAQEHDPFFYDRYKEANPARVQLFFIFYYTMTGLHVVHLIVGIGCILFLWGRARSGWITPERFIYVEVTSLYWHFVDLVWLFLLPLLYLAGATQMSRLHLPF
jgi:cytochrome c oxidase subunit 3